MNQQEKKKIDKLITEDINRAVSAYNDRRSQEKGRLVRKIMSTGKIGQAIKAWGKAHSEAEKLEKELDKMGFDVSYDGSVKENGYGNENENIVKFKQETDEGERKIRGLERTFALKLFANNAEAKELFESLAVELAKLV